MNVHDAISHSNSWHWLCTAAVAAAVASVLVPEYGWRDVLAYRDRTLTAQEKSAKCKLQELKDLCAIDVAPLSAETRRIKDETSKERAGFAKYGMEELPVGDKAVFAAQSRVGEALNRRKLRVVSSEARVDEVKTEIPMLREQPKKAQSKRMNPMTAEEILANAERAASKMKDKQLASMIREDARKKAAALRSGESTQAAVAAAPTSSARTSSTSAMPAQPFQTATLDYKVAGDFRDIFMFFVGETHRKPYYTFKDISVERGENDMALSFQLQVNHQ